MALESLGVGPRTVFRNLSRVRLPSSSINGDVAQRIRAVSRSTIRSQMLIRNKRVQKGLSKLPGGQTRVAAV